MSESFDTSNLFGRVDSSFDVRRPVLFSKSRMHAPAWYDPKTHPDAHTITVTQNGVPIPPVFSVAEVAPEFRWAIQPDGEVLDQREFAEKHERWWSERFTMTGSEIPDPSKRSIPRVERFVSRRVCEWEPDKVETIARTDPHKKFEPLVQYDMNGENPRPAVKEVTESDGTKGYKLVGDDPEKIRQAVEAARAVLDSQDEAEAAAAQAEVEQPDYPEEMVQARCGAMVPKRNHNIHVLHRCEKCKELKAIEKAEVEEKQRQAALKG